MVGAVRVQGVIEKIPGMFLCGDPTHPCLDSQAQLVMIYREMGGSILLMSGVSHRCFNGNGCLGDRATVPHTHVASASSHVATLCDPVL
jgi:hypothetical protein